MAQVSWTARARKDLDAISAFIAMDSPYYARRTEWAIYERSLALQEFPGIGHMVAEVGDPNLRELTYGNYRIIHWLMKPDHVMVIAVIHARRKPDGRTLVRRKSRK